MLTNNTNRARDIDELYLSRPATASPAAAPAVRLRQLGANGLEPLLEMFEPRPRLVRVTQVSGFRRSASPEGRPAARDRRCAG